MNALQTLQLDWDEEARSRTCVARARRLIAQAPRPGLTGRLALLLIAALPFMHGIALGLSS